MPKNNVAEKHWALTESAFRKLLAWLDLNEQRAAEKYERLCQKLRIFFEHRGCSSPEDLIDITLDRVARKLESGEVIEIADPASYCYGVAHFVLKEFWRSPSRGIISLDSQPIGSNPYTALITSQSVEESVEENEVNHVFLDHCLSRLSPEDRNLIVRYYDGDHQQRITNRHDLASELGISSGTLRIRALRIREQLYDCIYRCKRRGDGN